MAGCSARCSTKDDWPTTGPFWLQDGVITRLNFVPLDLLGHCGRAIGPGDF